MKEEYEKYYLFLEELRQSGETNMYGATPYLVREFDLDGEEAKEILINWMHNYKEISEKYYKEDLK